VTCGHLTIGTEPHSNGHFYARCALGDVRDRRKWLAVVSPARLEKMRELQQEFDRFTAPHRDRLLGAKAEVIRDPANRTLRRALEQQLTDFLDTVAAFLSKREARFQQVGLPVAQLNPLIDEWSWAWAKSRDLRDPQSFLGAPVAGGAAAEPLGASTMSGVPVYEDDLLRITRIVDPPRLRFNGDIDASNLEAVAEALTVAIVGARDLNLDLSGVAFCDLGGLRAIVRAAVNLEPSRRLVLSGTPGHLRRVFDVVGWASLPNLVVGEAAS
jgi:anti-anti-sigma factor